MKNFARNLDWNLLHTFMVVLQEQSMTRAAEALHRTQPAISQAIKRLETSAGVKLIERNKSKLVATEAGLELLQQIRPIYTTISRMPLLFSQAPEGVHGKIVIATIDQISLRDLDDVVQEFFDNHPRVDLEIKVATTETVLRAVRLGTATIGISDGIIPSDLKAIELFEEKFGLYCSSTHRLAGRSDVTENDLRKESFVSFTADVLGGEHMGDVTAYRAKASIGQRVRGQSSFVDQVCRMIEMGIGIGFLPVNLAEPFVDKGRIWRLPPYEEEPTASVFLVSNPSVHLSEAETRFLKRLDSFAQMS